MGAWDWVERGALDVATGGGYEVYKGAKDAYNYLYGDPAKSQKAAYQQAGADAAQLGNDQKAYYTTQGQKAMNMYGGNYDPNYAAHEKSWLGDSSHGDMAVDPNYGHNTYGVLDALNDERANRPQQQQQYFDYMKQQAAGKTNEETLYDQRKNGNDPAAQYEDTRATEGINKQLAARGRYNSGAGVRQISDYLANANAQRSHDLGTLAAGADSSRSALNTGYGSAATGASGETSKYFGDLTKGYQNANSSMADTFGHYADKAGDAYSQGQLARIEAQLAAAGVDAATRHQMLDDIKSGVKDGVQLGTGT